VAFWVAAVGDDCGGDDCGGLAEAFIAISSMQKNICSGIRLNAREDAVVVCCSWLA